ncbi:putative transposase [Streptomyces sp. NBRC 110611]|uniref:transposase n=1 Tax=Streptomyces sp. NBRC 110611 TaxID=1621259 RepID=UPI0008591B16|nr:transposase [Streptomyces sp. NBRC 110611]GAU71489.1 putative transposase [Streptomyces sp. NBRC 110611]
MQIALRSSNTISEVGRKLDINPETLRGWVKKHKQRNESPAGASLSPDERARLKELKPFSCVDHEGEDYCGG